MTEQVMTAPVEAEVQAPQAEEAPKQEAAAEVAAPEAQAETPTRKSLREMVDADEELRKEFQVEVNREKQKELARWKRERERETVVKAKDDPYAAQEYAQSKAKEFEEEEAAEVKPVAEHQQRSAEANQMLRAFWNLSDFQAEYPKWLEANRAEADKQWAKDPVEYMRYAYGQVMDRVAESRGRKLAETMAGPMAEELAKKMMQAVPQPPAGGPSGAGPHYGNASDIRRALANDEITAREARVAARRLGIEL